MKVTIRAIQGLGHTIVSREISLCCSHVTLDMDDSGRLLSSQSTHRPSAMNIRGVIRKAYGFAHYWPTRQSTAWLQDNGDTKALKLIKFHYKITNYERQHCHPPLFPKVKNASINHKSTAIRPAPGGSCPHSEYGGGAPTVRLEPLCSSSASIR